MCHHQFRHTKLVCENVRVRVLTGTGPGGHELKPGQAGIVIGHIRVSDRGVVGGVEFVGILRGVVDGLAKLIYL